MCKKLNLMFLLLLLCHQSFAEIIQAQPGTIITVVNDKLVLNQRPVLEVENLKVKQQEKQMQIRSCGRKLTTSRST